jgi:hypothetical protein
MRGAELVRTFNTNVPDGHPRAKNVSGAGSRSDRYFESLTTPTMTYCELPRPSAGGPKY